MPAKILRPLLGQFQGENSLRPARDSGHDGQGNQAQDDAAQAEKAQLAIAQGQQLLEHPAPSRWRDQRQQPFDHHQQRQGLPERSAVHESAYFLAGAAAPLPEPRMARKKSDEGSTTSTSLFLAKLAL